MVSVAYRSATAWFPPALRTTHEAGQTVVALRGEHDAFTSGPLADALATAIAGDDLDLVVDLSDVVFMGATTVGVLVRAHAFLKARGRAVTVRSPSAQARRVLGLCGVAELIESTSAEVGPSSPPSTEALDTWVIVPTTDRRGP